MPQQLSLKQARKIVLHSQRLPGVIPKGSAEAATLAAIEHLSYIQIDTISAVERAHHHTLWNRNPRYAPEQLDALVEAKQVFEYWSHAAAYLPMRDYRHSLPRKHALASGAQKHWFTVSKRQTDKVLKRIANEGPLMAKDFDNSGAKVGEWKSKPDKQALETLFMQGDLMIARRKSFHKVYDLTERVLPANIDVSLPTEEEHNRFLINSYLRANGLGRAEEIAYLLKNAKRSLIKTLQEMAANNELIELGVDGINYYALPGALQLLDNPIAQNKLKILSPFDNLLIQRKRMQNLFQFDYLIECYLPAAKRQYGYFSLPILWQSQLVARVDCKVDRKTATLNILYLAAEPGLTKHDAFCLALAKELKSFQSFNGCLSLVVQRATPSSLKLMLESCV